MVGREAKGGRRLHPLEDENYYAEMVKKKLRGLRKKKYNVHIYI
jgi:hypothetical protein